MKESPHTTAGRRRSAIDVPGLHVVCLGSGGGPSEDNVTGFLVRSIASEWAKGSLLAVDAGSHMASIIKILENDFPLVSAAAQQPQPSIDPETASLPCDDESSEECDVSTSPETLPITTLESGPFAGLAFPHASARANAVHVVREHVSTYLITHPHLDHLSGFAINTAAFHNTSRPKRLAALPFTVNAIKTHIFNDIIWPNLTDEDNGVGLVTFQRLTEGGNAALGEGTSRGFIEVCNGLAVKGFKVSHGNCASNPRPEQQRRRSSVQQPGVIGQNSHISHTHNLSLPPPQHVIETMKHSPETNRRSSIFSQQSQPSTPTFYGQSEYTTSGVVDSSAYFIRDDATGKEILMFGDVEPDSISLHPRTHIVWAEAAAKIANNLLSGVFIECSYSDAQKDAVLFGHLAPRHLIQELQTLAEMVAERKKEASEKTGRKRKRVNTSLGGPGGTIDEITVRRSKSRSKRASTPKLAGLLTDEPMADVPEEVQSPTALKIQMPHHRHPCTSTGTSISASPITTTTPPDELPLQGVTVIIIHVKDNMGDGPPVSDCILKELRAHEAGLNKLGRGLGCVFQVSKSGDSYHF